MQIRRFEFDGRVEEKGGQQFVSGRGLYGDGFTRIHRVEPHGFASSPPKGSKGLIFSTDPDSAYVLGLEHPGHRPNDLPAGCSAIYDASGNIIKVLGGDGIVINVAGSAYSITKNGVTLTISGAGVDITGGYLKVNGVRVDETHKHGGVVPGSGTSDVPNG